MLGKYLLWFVFGFLDLGVGLYPGMYFIIDRDFGLLSSKSDALLADVAWNAGFYTHIVLGGIAMLVGWTQFSSRIRNNHLRIHRTLGKIYVFSALPSGLAGLYIALFATGGLVAVLGFVCLAVGWFSTTLAAYLYIRKRKLVQHEKMMIFSYAFCFGAVTLRIWLPLLINQMEGEFVPAYRIVAWLCWMPNVIFASLYTLRLKSRSHTKSTA
jgi:Predicted membrane protein (DUF2306)